MSNNPIADERAYWHAQLGIVDDGSLSLGELRNRTAGAVHVNKAASAGDTSGLNFMTQAQGDARYPLLGNAIPLSATIPSKNASAGSAGSEGAAAHGDHVHPINVQNPTFLYDTIRKVTPLHSGSNTLGGLNRLDFVPYPLYPPDYRNITITQAGIKVATAAAAGGVSRFGLYRSLATGYPDMASGPLFDSGDIAVTTTGEKLYTLPAQIVIAPGLYWACAVSRVALPALVGADAGNHQPTLTAFDDGSMNTPQALGMAGVTGALPSSGSFVTVNDPGPNLWLMVA